MKDHEFQINLLTSSLTKPDLPGIPSQTKWSKIPMCGTFVVKFWFYFKSGVCAYGHISTYWITAGQGGMHLCLPCWNLSHISMVDMLIDAYLSDASKVWSNQKNIAHHAVNAVRNMICRHALVSRAQCSHTLSTCARTNIMSFYLCLQNGQTWPKTSHKQGSLAHPWAQQHWAWAANRRSERSREPAGNTNPVLCWHQSLSI